MATSQDFVNWVCGPDLLPVFLMQAFVHARAELRSLATGSTHRTIYFPTVKKFRVIVPPRALQEEFVARWQAVSGEIEQYERTVDPTDRLFASLQQRAFSGKLLSR